MIKCFETMGDYFARTGMGCRTLGNDLLASWRASYLIDHGHATRARRWRRARIRAHTCSYVLRDTRATSTYRNLNTRIQQCAPLLRADDAGPRLWQAPLDTRCPCTLRPCDCLRATYAVRARHALTQFPCRQAFSFGILIRR